MAHRVTIPTPIGVDVAANRKVGCHHCAWMPWDSLGGIMMHATLWEVHVRRKIHENKNPGHETFTWKVLP